MIPLAHMLYALVLLASYVSLFRPEGLVPGAIVLGFWAFVFYSDSRKRTFGIAMALAILGLCVWGLLLPTGSINREPNRRSTCKNNLKQIGIALHNYHEVHGAFPPAYIADENGTPLLSWRVLLLPFIDAEALFREFDLTKAWDSPENLKLIKQMPSVFACPSQHSLTRMPTTTSYVAVVGPRMAWPDSKPLKYGDFVDGLDATIMLIEHHAEIPWTEPRDVRLEEAVNALTSATLESFNHRSDSFFSKTFFGPTLLTGDGRVFSTPIGISQTRAAELMTIDDRKPASDWDLADAGNFSSTQTKWINVILLVMFVSFTLLPLPWVWIHRQGVKTQTTMDKPEVPPPTLP